MRLLMRLSVPGMLFMLACSTASAEPTHLLWPDGAPGALGTAAKDQPQVTVYLPPEKQATGAAVVVCPGGGYGGLASSYEGHDIARWFNSFGVAGVVLDYRHRGKGFAINEVFLENYPT